MYRLFVAIRPPTAVRTILLGAMGGIRGARWQTDDQLHLTLRFIGDADRHRARDVAAALGSIHQPPFEIALSGAGVFDKVHPDAVWAGVTPHESLSRLHKKVDQALERVGVPVDGRAYLPHITLARLKRSSGPIGGFVEEAGGLTSPPFRVDAFGLFESTLSADGAVYEELERYPLG